VSRGENDLKEVRICFENEVFVLQPKAPEKNLIRTLGNAIRVVGSAVSNFVGSAGYVDVSNVYVEPYKYHDTPLEINLPVEAPSLVVTFEARFEVGNLKTMESSGIYHLCMSDIIKSSISPVDITLSSPHTIRLSIVNEALFTDHPSTTSSVDKSTSSDLQQTLEEATQALSAWKGAMVSAPHPGPPIAKTSAEDLVENVKRDVHRHEDGFDVDYETIESSGHDDLIKKMASLADELHMSGRAFYHKANKHAASTQLDDLINLIVCNQETTIFAVTIEVRQKVIMMLNNSLLQMDRIRRATEGSDDVNT